MPRKLVYLSTAIIPSRQANSVQIMKMCGGLSRFGFDVTLLAGVPPGDVGVDIFEHYGVDNTFSTIRRLTGCHRGSTFLLSLRHYPALRRLAKNSEDILFYGRDVLALYALARAGRKVTYEVHDMVWKGPRSWAEERLIKSEELESLVFISNELKRSFLERYGMFLSEKNMVVAPDAADEQPNFDDSVDLKGDIDFAVCYIGSFLEGRGIELILKVAGRMPDVGFHLFGGTDNQVCELEQNSPPNVWFYKYLPPAQTYKIRNAADSLVMPYQKKVMVALDASETSRWMSPIKLFEYMSSAKPIISSDHAALREILEDNRNCLLCEPDDVEQWVRAIRRIRQDKQLRDRIAQAAYNDFRDKYTWDKRIRHILDEDHAACKE
jgi:glycosyltransferase involved in cell wall biosynthesis